MTKNKYKVISITDMWGNPLPIENMEFWFIGKNYAIGHFKGYGFDKRYSSCNGYTVITKEV